MRTRDILGLAAGLAVTGGLLALVGPFATLGVVALGYLVGYASAGFIVKGKD